MPSPPTHAATQGKHISLAEALSSLSETSTARSVELFRHGTLLVKWYAPRGTDLQQPHTRDEVYVVARGSGDFVHAGSRVRFEAGDFLFAAANVVHRFENFTGDLGLWVLFYGPEGGELREPS
jgi:mannose-6-phosphate isomerase-like protein (cupin superfamily)